MHRFLPPDVGSNARSRLPLLALTAVPFLSSLQSDDIIWQVVNYQFCSFKSKIAEEQTFCR